MLTRARLEQVLRAYPAGVEWVSVVGDFRFVATVVSRSFENKNEVDRQVAVSKYLHSQLSEDELPKIEFIFTDTPAERATG